jgi:hypothetical protein
MELLVTAIIVGIVVYGLERNRSRQAAGPQTHLAGSSDVVDRDTERISCELRFRDRAIHS